jgi:DNA (cytosine-5)-methyltransferase 1
MSALFDDDNFPIVQPGDLTLGSLFDGLGGFMVTAERNGITPLWASEIEPNCISITSRHFPTVKHYGDLTKLDGAKLHPVDIITFGSPCQEFSVANPGGEGLQGKRSGLFYEAIRIIQEMRGETDNGTDETFPRYAIFENVPGAFGKHNGEDFRQIVEAFCQIKSPEVRLLKPKHKWNNAGVVRGDGYSIAWRVLDAQFWGVPQRRKRIALVADFRGHNADKILFEQKGDSGT